MYPVPPDRVITWRSVLAGYVVVAGIFVLLVAVSYPAVTLAVTAGGAGAYLLYRALRAASARRTTRLPRVPPRYEPTSRSK